MNEKDWHWMKRALELAEKGRGFVEPNPLVGAVLVKEDRLIGEGWHERFGEAHAEINALKQAGERARGTTLFVTLEPCCHQGKTPPCTEALIQAGIRRVVAAMSDPFPRVAGRGAEQLRKAGIDITFGLGEDESRRLNAPYLKLLSRARPYVHAKWAMSLDGKIATRSGDSRWISNEASRRRVHELRGRMDGILVGIGTVLADDPLLNARPPGPRLATRIILDSQGRIPPESQLMRTAREIPIMVVTGPDITPQKRESLSSVGCEVLSLPTSEARPQVEALLDELGRRRITNLLVEGGAEVLGSFAAADAIDEFHVYIAPHLVGGSGALSPVGGLGVETMKEALCMSTVVETIEGDIFIHGWREEIMSP